VSSRGEERDALAYLTALTRPATRGWIELRISTPGHDTMQPRYFAVTNARAAVRVALARAHEDDVYVGVATRARSGDRGGGKAQLDQVGVLWVDCDDRRSVDALAGFAPAPAMIVRSSERGCHAYWPLRSPLSVPEAEQANRRLAHALGACASAVLNAAAILRLPGTANHKYDPPARVELVRFTGDTFEPQDVVGALPEPPGKPPVPTAGGRRPGGEQAGEPLLAIEPRVYVERLTGLVAGRNGKVPCPFHTERTPSCHLFETAGQGWFCFGCRAGGDVYNFGALLLGIPHRSPAFLRLRRVLYARLLPGVPVPAWCPRSVSAELR
jgi:hypothetical protein